MHSRFKILAVLGFMVFSFSGFQAMDVLSEAMAPVAGDSVREVAPGVWAGQGFASSGEPIYFGFELVDKTNFLKWDRFAKDARKCGYKSILEDGSALYELVSRLFYNEDLPAADAYGFTDTEMGDYINDL